MQHQHHKLKAEIIHIHSLPAIDDFITGPLMVLALKIMRVLEHWLQSLVFCKQDFVDMYFHLYWRRALLYVCARRQYGAIYLCPIILSQSVMFRHALARI